MNQPHINIDQLGMDMVLDLAMKSPMIQMDKEKKDKIQR